MSDRCVWMIVVGNTDTAARSTAATLAPYGVVIQGQALNVDQANGWLVCAQSAAQASARFVVVVSSSEDYKRPEVRRQLSLFRLFLQTFTKSTINGMVNLVDSGQADARSVDLPGTPILADWETITTDSWAARAVARLHSPKRPSWPVALGLFGQEKIGTWLEVQPMPGQSAPGCLLGVSGNEAKISFHAAGPAGCLPDRSINEYELKGLTFSCAGHDFHAWGLQNALPPEQAYFARLENEPDLLAVSTLPNGELSEVHLMCLR
ncbi:MAG TPA: hypothetical protein VIC30_04410 [Orrella sp.]